METLWNDLRYAIRTLSRKPGFTATIILVLALGIGVTSAIFTVVDSVLLQPLPFPEPNQLAMIWETIPSAKVDQNTVAPANFVTWQKESRSFDGIAAWSPAIVNLVGAGDPEQIVGHSVSGNYFSVLGVHPFLGRLFAPEEDLHGGPHAVILGNGLWRRHFGSDPNILGKNITLGAIAYQVIGVMPATFESPYDFSRAYAPEFWIPLALSNEEAQSQSHTLVSIARLKRGVNRSAAQSEMEGIMAHMQGMTKLSADAAGVNIVSLEEQRVGAIRPALLVLFSAAGFVLLIGCANVANLLFVRAIGRGKETAIRASLGASPWRLVRQFLTESLVLSAAGGLAGFLLVQWGIALLDYVMPIDLIPATNLSVDWKVFAFTAVASIFTGALCGILPALQGLRPNLIGTLKEGGKSSSGGVRSRARNILVVAEIAIACALLIGAGLLLKTFVHLNHVEMGFNASNILTLDVSLPSSRYGDAARESAFYDQLIPRIKSLPGVESVAAINGLPVSFEGGGGGFFAEGSTEQTPLITAYRIITPDYFQTMKIPLAAGRSFDSRDRTSSANVAIVSQSFATRFWPHQSPLGKRVKWGSDGPWMSVVGVANDVKLDQTNVRAPRFVYMPYTQVPVAFAFPYELAVRTSVPPETLTSAIRKEVAAVDGQLAIAKVRTMDQILSTSIAKQRFNFLLMGIFAALALALVTAGIYGVVSYGVVQRTHEIGVRMALGAKPADVLRLILKGGIKLIAVGLILGIAGAVALTRAMETLLIGVKPTDALTFISVSVLLAGIALLACYLPARRAARVDPIVALHYE